MKSFIGFFALLVCTAALCQTTPDHSLTLETIGHGFWKSNRPFGFRVYSTSDGTKARVDYLTFKSRDEANQYLRTCLKPEAKIIYKQQKKDTNAQVTGERIITEMPKSGKKDFAIIRGVGLNYYFIGSSSLGTAMQVEELIRE